MKLATLNKKETKFLNDCFGHIYSDKEMEKIYKKHRELKTFLRELKKVEKKHGYEPHEADITNAIGYFGFDHYESIEEFIYCFKDDLKEGAKRYFEYYY